MQFFLIFFRLCAAVLAVYAGLFLAGCSVVESRLSRDEQLTQLLNDTVGSKAHGVLLYLDTPGDPFLGEAGVADRETGAPIKIGSTLRLGSITKTYVAALAVRAAEQGLLDLDAQIGTYLDADVMAKLPSGLNPTVRQLLNHTSGVPDYYSERFYETDWKRTEPLTPDLVLHAIRGLEATTTPGTDYAYSNTNYHLAALTLEAVTGKPIKDQFAGIIFEPLELEETYYDSAFPPGDVIHGYGSPFGEWEDTYEFRENSGPDGGMFATAADTARWIRALFSEEGAFADTGRVMTANPVKERERKEQGMGAEILISRSGARVVGHTGAIDGYLTAAFYIPAADTVMVLHMNKFDDALFSSLTGNTLRIVMATTKDE